MSKDEVDLETAIQFLDSGRRNVRLFEAGPPAWLLIGSAEISEEFLADYLTVVMDNEAAMGESFISGKRKLLHQYVDILADAFEEWARDFDRPDLLATVSDRLNRAVKP